MATIETENNDPAPGNNSWFDLSFQSNNCSAVRQELEARFRLEASKCDASLHCMRRIALWSERIVPL